MIRILQKKFIVTAMIAVTVLLLVVLGALNVVNLRSNIRQAEMMLDMLGFQGDRGPFEGPVPDGMREPRRFLDEPMDENARMSAVYFRVDLDEHRNVIRTDVSHIASVTEEEASAMARALDPGRESGKLGSFRYRFFSTPAGGYRVVFLDSAARQASVLRVALLSLLLGLVSWLLMLVLVMLLSKKAIQPIAENMQRQRQFVTDAGHELKTPLAIILANVDALELRAGESKYSRNIRTQAKRLSDLMKNLLTLARMDELSTQEHSEQLDFSALCTDSFSMFREGAELRQLAFSLEIEDHISIRGDRSQLSQLCSILGDNAVKYCAAQGEIRIRLKKDSPGSCCLRVMNTVSEKPDVDHLFDRFYRSDVSRNQKEGGFGIGLSAAQAIAALHRTALTAEYDAATASLSFLLRLPTVDKK